MQKTLSCKVRVKTCEELPYGLLFHGYQRTFYPFNLQTWKINVSWWIETRSRSKSVLLCYFIVFLVLITCRYYVFTDTKTECLIDRYSWIKIKTERKRNRKNFKEIFKQFLYNSINYVLSMWYNNLIEIRKCMKIKIKKEKSKYSKYSKLFR